MLFRCVPFNPQWPIARGQSGAFLLDIHAIYRRPQVVQRKDEAAYLATDEAGLPIWDLTGGLPVRDHAKWEARGFQYITLEGRDDLIAVSKEELAEQGVRPLDNWREYAQHPVTGAPWVVRLYLQDLAAERASEIAALQEQIRTMGPQAAEAITRARYPHYALPPAFVEATLGQSAASDAAPPTRRRRGRPRKARQAKVETPAEAVPA